MDKKKKITLAVVGAVELAIIVVCLVMSILVLTSGYNGQASSIANKSDLVKWLCTNSVWFFVLFVLPLIIIFVVDGIYLILYATKKESMLSKEEKEVIAEEAKRQAKEEILRELRQEMAAENTEKKE